MFAIRGKGHFLSHIANNTRRPAVKRAIENDCYEHLGFFDNVNKTWQSKTPGWILKVIGESQVWYMAMFENEKQWSVYAIEREDVDWASWAGDRMGKTKLYTGDNPEKYLELRNAAKLYKTE